MPRRPEPARTATLTAVAALTAALLLAGAVHGAAQSVVQAAAGAWHAVFPDRTEPAAGERMIVVLSAPSLADRVAAAETAPSREQERRWTLAAEEAQEALLAGLRARGIELEPDLRFTRTINAFSAPVDPRAVAELERNPLVVGVYPVRVVYPAAAGEVALAGEDFGPGGGRRADVSLPGFDGRGVTVALLDTGVDRSHPFLHGRVLRGHDVVAGDRRALAEPHPGDRARLEGHGTRMAGLIAGEGGPGDLAGVAPGATVLPIRILGWQESRDGSWAVMGRGDQLIAGFERAVDPDGDGDTEDAATVAVAPVVEPYAAFIDSPEARSVAGATALGTLVVAPSGNDGRAGAGFGSVGAPGGAPAALTVGAVDARRNVFEADLTVELDGEQAFKGRARVLGVIAPSQELSLPVRALLGPTLAQPGLAPAASASGAELADFFDAEGVSRVAARAALVSAEGAPVEQKARNAAAAGAAALLVYGTGLPAGSLDLDESSALPVIGLPAAAGRVVAAGLAAGEEASVSLAAVEARANRSYLAVAPFSSGGLAFDGRVKPDLVAPGVGLATADAGSAPDGTPRYATATGSSVAAALVAGAAALLAEARPELGPAELKGLLTGNASRLVVDGSAPEPVTLQGAGLLDLARAAAGEAAVEPATLAFGRASGVGWSSTRTIAVTNLSTRPLELGLGFVPDQGGDPSVTFAAEPAQLGLDPGASAEVALTASVTRDLAEGASGVIVLSGEGLRPVRVPWAVALRPDGEEALVDAVSLSHFEFRPSKTAPAVLAFRAGRVVPGAGGGTVEPVGVLDVELWTAGGERLGVLARLRDVLPGRYAYGLTGRDPEGKVLAPGTYVLRLQAQPVDGDDGTPPSTAEAVFRITD